MIVQEVEEEAVSEAWAGQVSALMSELAGEHRVISLDELRAVARDNHLFVAVVGSTIIGLVCLVPMHLPQGIRLWVESVIVHPAHRRAGAGHRLMAALLERASGYGDVPITLTSNPTRVHAHKLFEEFGFRRVETGVFRRRSHHAARAGA